MLQINQVVKVTTWFICNAAASALRIIVGEFISTMSNRNTLNRVPLRFEQVVIMTTCFIRNTLTIRPLAAGIATIERV